MDNQHRDYDMMGSHVNAAMYEPDQIVANDYQYQQQDTWSNNNSNTRYK